ncbi:hypothetical protein [Leptotrichia sp. oral taxon 847]|uniref:hypothetical protein n=1 Tax=Leptotrichia sp. oral taxon 847 TaxID=1785996 RepID=UPI0007683763|nr:hypothetical protein [Leptotrichia sp. oral taxon 847]AMD94836.1 hypothetical protein AXF11_04000 [Leptotrichia sp. oral taxon 847]
MKENYKLSFKNIEKLWNVSIYFSDVKNILNCEIKKDSFEKENLVFNPKIIYGTNDFEKQNGINQFFVEQISKIQKRKKIIYEATIKDRDGFLKNKKDNKNVDYKLSVLDFFNYFGYENLKMEVVDEKLEENYLKTSEKILKKLFWIYKKRYEEFEYLEEVDEEIKRSFEEKENLRNKIKKNKINEIYIFMKIYNFIKENFEYEKIYFENGKEILKKEKFLVGISILKNLKLNFNFEKNKKDRDFYKLAKKFYKARIFFDVRKKSILIPENLLKNKKEIFYKKNFPKEKILKKLIFEKFEEIIKKNLVVKNGVKFYLVNIEFYNINMKKINFFEIAKSVVFKDLIDELRKYIVGVPNENGIIEKKNVKLNDINLIKKIMNFQKKQIEIEFKDILEKNLENEEKIKKLCEEKKFELEKKNKDFSFNFKIKNLKKPKKVKNQKVVGIFLNDIYSVIEEYKNKNLKDKNYHFDKEFIFIKVYFLLLKKFNFVVPFSQKFGNKNFERLVTVAFFDEISCVNLFLDGVVFRISDFDILQDEYKFFRGQNFKREIIFLNNEKKIEKKEVLYEEYLEYKYKKNFKIDKKNPFELNEDNIDKFFNLFKYHRILDENIKYIFFNINSRNEIFVQSSLFKNFFEFLKLMNGFEKIILYGEKKSFGKKVEIKNFRLKSSKFDIYLDKQYFKTENFYLEGEESCSLTKKIKNIF